MQPWSNLFYLLRTDPGQDSSYSSLDAKVTPARVTTWLNNNLTLIWVCHKEVKLSRICEELEIYIVSRKNSMSPKTEPWGLTVKETKWYQLDVSSCQDTSFLLPHPTLGAFQDSSWCKMLVGMLLESITTTSSWSAVTSWFSVTPAGFHRLSFETSRLTCWRLQLTRQEVLECP